jgi:hypothetical protein
MKYLLHNKKLTFSFTPSYVSCYNYIHGNYQTNEILSFAVMDLAFKIIKQQKREFIILKKRRPIIHLLNYIDTLNSNFNSKEFNITCCSKNNYFNITLFLKINYETIMYNLHSYQRRHFKNFYKDRLEVIERENLCIIRFEEDYVGRVQPKNINLTTMVIHILEKEKINEINVDGIILYCVFLM